MPLSRHAQLAQLLVDLFGDAGEMRRMVRASVGLDKMVDVLPADTVSAVNMADTIAFSTVKQGRVSILFRALHDARPHRAEEIERVRSDWSRSYYEASNAKYILLPVLGVLFAGLGLATIVPLPTPSNNSGWADNGPTMQPAARPRPVVLDPHGVDQIEIKVVSRRTGVTWNVLVSKHLSAKNAAERIFNKVFLGENEQVRSLLTDDTYEFCQSGKCYSDESIGELKPEITFYIARSASRNPADIAHPLPDEEERRRNEIQRKLRGALERCSKFCLMWDEDVSVDVRVLASGKYVVEGMARGSFRSELRDCILQTLDKAPPIATKFKMEHLGEFQMRMRLCRR